MDAKIFSVKIRDLRKEQELTQQDLADKLGVSRQTVFLVESGQSLPSLPLAIKFASIFHQSIEDLLDIQSEFDRFFEDPLTSDQDAKNIYIEAAVPGFSAEEIEIEISEEQIKINGSNKQSFFERTISLPQGIDFNNADSTLKNGILTITLPKSPEVKPKIKKLKPRAN